MRRQVFPTAPSPTTTHLSRFAPWLASMHLQQEMKDENCSYDTQFPETAAILSGGSKRQMSQDWGPGVGSGADRRPCNGSSGKYALDCSDHHFIEQWVLPKGHRTWIPGLFVGSGQWWL